CQPAVDYQRGWECPDRLHGQAEGQDPNRDLGGIDGLFASVCSVPAPFPGFLIVKKGSKMRGRTAFHKSVGLVSPAPRAAEPQLQTSKSVSLGLEWMLVITRIHFTTGARSCSPFY